MEDRPKAETVEHALGLVEQAAGSDLILLPEIWPCGFFSFDRYRSDSEALEGPTVTAFRQKARDHHTHILMGSLVEQDGQNFYNSTIFIDPQGEIVARYRKI
jgi:predicted amidohydrolase